MSGGEEGEASGAALTRGAKEGPTGQSGRGGVKADCCGAFDWT